MKQIQIAAFGLPSQVVRVVDVPDPTPLNAWEVIVGIEAFPINTIDLATMRGQVDVLPSLPATIGVEAVGRVQQCGSSVREVQPGDRVVLLSNNNWCNRRKVTLANVLKVSSDADPLQLAMLKVAPASAYMLLKNYRDLIEGDWILQTDPLSSIGQCIMQLARHMGVRTVNIVEREDQASHVLASGGSIAITAASNLANRVAELVKEKPISLAFDALASAGTMGLIECLADGSTLISYGALNAAANPLTSSDAARQISWQQFSLTKQLLRLSPGKRLEMYELLASMMTSGRLKIAIDSTWSLNEIQAALERAEQGESYGMVLVTPGKGLAEV